MFTAAEYYDMLIVYGACGESAYAAVEAYAARFPANYLKLKELVMLHERLALHKMKRLFFRLLRKMELIDSDDKVYGAETLNSFINTSLKGYPMMNRFPVAEFDPDEQVVFLMCSSGTTGLPKGVMQTHSNLMVRYMHTIDPRYTIKTDVFLGILPFFHGYGLVTNFFALVLNQKIVVIKRFREELFLKAIQDHKIENLWLAPPLVVLLAKSPLVEKYNLSSIKEVVSGAAPLSRETEEAVKKRLNIDLIRQGYGLTEATLGVIMMSAGDKKHGSSGRVVTYMSCKVRDPETGRSLGPGEIGELCFKGPMLMKGYYGNDEATRNSFTSDGWLLTGDLGYYDEDNYFYVVDRLKELIKYKGFQVAPAELEAILLNHPNIKDVGVVGVPDEEVGELPLAFVVKDPQSNLTEDDIIKYVAEKVSSQKRLRGGVVFVPAIPKNPSGKILRRELRKLLGQMLKSKLSRSSDFNSSSDHVPNMSDWIKIGTSCRPNHMVDFNCVQVLIYDLSNVWTGIIVH
ncbi:hypothetical protein GEV33_004100 [Tenebrio molitor]|uniref:Luciferin 4-monooxygenase n=1 Tax=Tenebrio molitor TaxID=7067 RepID=A0A8J6LN19_TENMO|nr:hypothetical protein GEV33_004100 [Tenebrio molitor]